MNTKNRLRVLLATAALSCPAAAHAQRSQVSSGLVLDGVAVVDTRTGQVKPDQAVAVDGGKIVKIGKAGSFKVGGTAKLVNARGKYVVPGFLDMHIHAVDSARLHPTFFPLLIANGINSLPGGVRHSGKRRAGQEG